ncbi:two-component system response regulator BtsR [Paraferrimonas sedimenticola]|uniref:Response regulatory protein n=1 Tax=Paraferrimonas sedimenticola TaxID=375674 RepID=A0AA37RT79_9GAMM|nr:two-component system response regulator BtsR [Paraferrimonas sedimenticola]GLP95191.1 putative response regulatory protein [Paraferrimonas sedimenticola]
MIRCLIIDDELNAREELKASLAEHSDIEVIAEGANAFEGIKLINQHQPDLVFLDIQMPRISGLEMLSMIDDQDLPRVVFVTAYDEYAVQAFDANAFDYLLKPIEPSRLERSLERVRANLTPQAIEPLVSPKLASVPCYNQNRLRVLKPEQIDFVYSDVGGVHVVSGDIEHHTQLTLKVLEQKTDLIRCHRQYLVRLEAIAEISVNEGGAGGMITCHSGRQLPISRRYQKGIKQAMGF